MATVFTNKGCAITTGQLSAITALPPKYIGWGTGVTAAAVTDTALVTESAEARTTGTMTQQTVTVTNDTFRVVGTITATAGRAITEMGLFDASTVGNLFLRSVFSVVNLLTNDSIQFTVNTTFAAG